MVAMATIPNTQAAIFMTRLCNAAAGDAESRRIPCRPGSEAWTRKHLPAPSERGPAGRPAGPMRGRQAEGNRALAPYFASFLALGVGLSFFGPALPTLRD